jgi:hypothetical protein
VTETVLLQARIYNYSHVDMDAPSLAQKAAAVKVRFYGQVFQSDTGEYPVGQSFLIGEQTLAPIPGYASTNTPGDAPNWSMAIQAFDPGAFAPTQVGNVYLRFWVVVWMEDSAGNLVQEMAGHGLTANPAHAKINTLGDVQVEPYGNNAGTYKQVFYVQGRGDGAGRVVSIGKPPAVTLTTTLLSAAEAAQPGKHLLTSVIRNGDGERETVQALYYDGDPAQAGRLFDWELIPQLSAGEQHVNRVTYTPRACGDRTIYVVVRLGEGEITSSAKIAGVRCALNFPLVKTE